MNKAVILGVGVLAASAVAGAVVGGKTAYGKYDIVKEKTISLKNKFYDKVTKIDSTGTWDDSDVDNQVAWG